MSEVDRSSRAPLTCSYINGSVTRRDSSGIEVKLWADDVCRDDVEGIGGDGGDAIRTRQEVEDDEVGIEDILADSIYGQERIEWWCWYENGVNDGA
jgi:hypothetical protein